MTLITKAHRAEARRRLYAGTSFAGFTTEEILAQALAEDAWTPPEAPEPGMTLRDRFAGQALIGIAQEYLHRNGFHGDTLFPNLATHAYRVADAMLAERSKGQ